MILAILLSLLAVSTCKENYKGVKAVLLYTYPQLRMSSNDVDKIKHLLELSDVNIVLPNGLDGSLAFGRHSRSHLNTDLGLLLNETNTERVYVQSIDSESAINNTLSFLRGLLWDNSTKSGEEVSFPDIVAVPCNDDKILSPLFSDAEAVKKLVDEKKDQSVLDELESLQKSISSSFMPIAGFSLSFDEISGICELISHLNHEKTRLPAFITPELLDNLQKFCRLHNIQLFRNPNKLFKMNTGGRFVEEVNKNFLNTEKCLFGNEKTDPFCDNFGVISVYVTDKRNFMSITNSFAINSTFFLDEWSSVLSFGLYSRQEKLYVRLMSLSENGVFSNVRINGCGEYCLLSEFTRIHKDLIQANDSLNGSVVSSDDTNDIRGDGLFPLSRKNKTQTTNDSGKKNATAVKGSVIVASNVTTSSFIHVSNDSNITTTHHPNVTTTGTTHSPNVTTTGTTHSPNVTTTGTTHSPNVTTTGTTHSPNVTTTGTTHSPNVTTTGTTHSPNNTTTAKPDISTTVGPNTFHNLRVSSIVAWVMACVLGGSTCVLLFLYLKLRHLHYLGYRSINDN